MNAKSYKDVKICCYAIAANEPEAFIDRWLESMSGADYIVVLVTKEGDSNYNYFKQKQRLYSQLQVYEHTITPWRFDVARNESMNYIPLDSDVIVCTDIDEILIEDFWDDLRKCVFDHPNFERIYYRYAWSHDNEGNPNWVFWYDKITQPIGWEWKFPVHESLHKTVDKYEGQYYLDSNKIYLHHYPDNTKSRSSYLRLLELRAQEYPEDLYGLFYLTREYSFAGKYSDAIATGLFLYNKLKEQDVIDDMRMLPSLCCQLGQYYNILKRPDKAETYYKESISLDPSFRDGYIKLAQLLAYQGRYKEVYSIIEQMNKDSVYREDWRVVSYYWRDWKVKQILADAKCWEGKYEEALSLFIEAQHDIKNKSDIQDAISEGFYRDLDFLWSKLGLK